MTTRTVHGWEDSAKRALDVVLAVVALLLLSPLLAAVALAVRLDSGGPAFFRQERVGRGGKPFRIHKFRSMRVASAGPAVTVAGDDRITRTGLVLRRWKLDELPQLIDVVVGSMSLVGPRPEVPQYVRLWPEDLRRVVLSVRPGITDPATIALRDESDVLSSSDEPERYYVEVLMPRKLALYAEYVRTRSLGGDLRILLRTVAAVLRPGRSRGLD